MNLCSFKVFLCLLVGYNLFTVVTPFTQERTFHPALRQHAEFGEGIRDWFRGVRDKVRHFFKPTTTPPPPPVDVESVKKEIMNKFFLDLANTRFNPDRDWGFRMGSWYFIKKADDSSDDKFPDYVPTTTTTTESVDEFTREREELITSTSAQSAVYTEEIETLEHGHVDFTSLHPVENTEKIETSQPEYNTFATVVTNIFETTIGESFSSTQESVGANDINTTAAATTEIVETQPKQVNENEIPSKDPQSAEVISP